MERQIILSIETTGPENQAAAQSNAPVRALSASKLLSLVTHTLDDAKAEETVCIDLDGKSPIADHMVVTTGRSGRHVAAIADQLRRKLKDTGLGRPRTEGLSGVDWVLVDAGDVIVHIFRPEVRAFYNLEKLWSTTVPEDQRTG
ncbi:MAG: ribosome silencing factor [Hyphomicrobiales bacterium]